MIQQEGQFEINHITIPFGTKQDALNNLMIRIGNPNPECFIEINVTVHIDGGIAIYAQRPGQDIQKISVGNILDARPARKIEGDGDPDPAE